MNAKKQKKDPVFPKWELTEQYGVGIDPLNWKLMRKASGDDGKWKTIGYYQTPEALLRGLVRHIQRQDSDQPTIEEHLKEKLALIYGMTEKFSACLLNKDLYVDTTAAEYFKACMERPDE